MKKLSLLRNAQRLYSGQTVTTYNVQIHIKELYHKLYVPCHFVAVVLFYTHSLIINANTLQ